MTPAVESAVPCCAIRRPGERLFAACVRRSTNCAAGMNLDCATGPRAFGAGIAASAELTVSLPARDYAFIVEIEAAAAFLLPIDRDRSQPVDQRASSARERSPARAHRGVVGEPGGSLSAWTGGSASAEICSRCCADHRALALCFTRDPRERCLHRARTRCTIRLRFAPERQCSDRTIWRRRKTTRSRSSTRPPRAA